LRRFLLFLSTVFLKERFPHPVLTAASRSSAPRCSSSSPLSTTSVTWRDDSSCPVETVLLTTLSVRQAVEHLFKIDFGAKTVRSFPLPVARVRRFSQPDPGISTEKFLELAKK